MNATQTQGSHQKERFYQKIKEYIPHGQLGEIAKKHDVTPPRLTRIIKGSYRIGSKSHNIYREILSIAEKNAKVLQSDLQRFANY